MSLSQSYYFVYLEHLHTSSPELPTAQQAFSDWLDVVEPILAELPLPAQQQYHQKGLQIMWEANRPLLPLILILQRIAPHSRLALHQGIAIYDSQRDWYYSNIPAQLPALLAIGQHYEQRFVIGEEASQSLPKKQLTYLTRSYLAGASTALEVYAWE